MLFRKLILIGVFLILVTGCQSQTYQTLPEERIDPEEFPEELLNENFELLYGQLSKEFQEQVSFKEFSRLSKDFNRDVESYQLISTLEIEQFTEYQWLASSGDQGIRAYFSEDRIIAGLQLLPVTANLDSDQNFTKNTYTLPVKGEWFVFWGGNNELLNYHYPIEAQRYAYDLVVMKDGMSYEGDPKVNESYFAFGEEVLAPADGKVVSIENQIPDNEPVGQMNPDNPLGNYVIIEHGPNEYSIIAHLKEGSLTVSEGDVVQSGEVIGLVGNSGNSTEPHIHFQVSDSSDWETAKSIRIKLNLDHEPVRGNWAQGFY